MSTTPLPVYNLICLPLDGRDPSKSDKLFSLRIITELQFSASTTIHSGAIHDVAFQHPLFCLPSGKSIKAYIWDFGLWFQNGRTMDKSRAYSVQLKSASGSSATDIMNHLSIYLSGDKSVASASSFEHDAHLDSLTPADFLDSARGADQLKQESDSLRGATARALAFKAMLNVDQPSVNQADSDLEATESSYNLEATSLGMARWLDAAVHSSLVEALHSNVDREHPNAYRRLGMNAVAMTGVQDTIAKISRRMTVAKDFAIGGQSNDDLKVIASNGTDKVVSKLDLNVALHAALKNDLLATSCGLSSNWIVQTDFAIGGDRDWVIQIDVDSLSVDPTLVSIQQHLPTVFRRRGHTHPLAYSDLKATTATNCAFAALNASDGSVRYRASSTHPEKSLIKQVIVQSQNSLLGPNAADETLSGGVFTGTIDTRAPELLRNQQYGTPEPETTGVVFSAPAEDLITPKDLSNPQTRASSFPCFFLEDLWIGYRLDLRKDSSKTFTSIHKQSQRLTLRGSGQVFQGPTETFIEREQPDDPRIGSSSTDLTTYNGLSSGQMKDYLLLLGLSQTSASSNERFVTETLSYAQTERLLFGHDYEYQLRNVFRGGNSLDTSSLEYADDAFVKLHRQTFPFYRARALRPGELFSTTPELSTTGKAGSTIYISSGNDRQTVYLVPTPIDIDTSRFHGLLLEQPGEPSAYKNRMYVADLTKYFDNKPPDSLNYFFDPDVFGVSVHVVSLNGNESDEPEEVVFKSGVYSRLARHTIQPPITKRYGKNGVWQDFKSIALSFTTTLGNKLLITNTPDDQAIQISVPPGIHLKVILLPLFARPLARKNASHAASSAQLMNAMSVAEAAPLFNIPAIAEQSIEVVHALEQPRFPPTITCGDIPPAFAGEDAVIVPLGKREPNGMFGTIVGRIDLDAATTKEVSLNAVWSDIDDASSKNSFTLSSVDSSSSPRSVLFQPYIPLPPKSKTLNSLFDIDGQRTPTGFAASFRVENSSYGFADQFALQCAENKIFLGQDEDDPTQGDANNARISTASKNALRIDLKDAKRKLATISAVGLGRHADKQYKSPKATASSSKEVLLDFPSSSVMTSPVVSHIVPLRKADEHLGDHAGQVQAVYGFRIYVERPFFESGHGERLAIGCLAGPEVVSSSGEEIAHYVTKWGEDPVERAALDVTRRMPKASDFSSIAPDPAGKKIDPVLYPSGVVGGQRPVIYRDNLRLPDASNTKPRWVSISSFAVKYDSNHALWYADVQVDRSFFGVCGLAIYRHQPHAVPGYELSQVCAWAYAAVVYGEPIAWVEKDNNLNVTIGPVYDQQIAFDIESIPFEQNVSRDLTNTIIRPVKTYSVGLGRYFELVIPKNEFDWSLVKKRYGIPFTSLRLNRKQTSASGGDNQ